MGLLAAGRSSQKKYVLSHFFLFSRKRKVPLERLEQHVESLIFASDNPLSVQEMQACLQETFGMEFHQELIEKAIEQLRARYAGDDFAFEIVEIAGGHQFMTKGAYHPTVATLLKQRNRRRLSQAALETLSIIAYKQPVSKSALEKIRGVNCDYALQKLLEKELVTITGRSEGPGRPLLYGTSEKFMNYFGLRSLRDLPQPREFQSSDQVIGQESPIEEPL
jgi:segregation and condensation protein B